jgi:hypothetical protein
VPYARLAGRAHRGVAVADLELAGAPLVAVWRAGTTSALDREQIAGSRDVGAAAAFSRRLGGRVLSFTASGGQVRDRQTGSAWDPFGRATAGPLAGRRLTRPAPPTRSGSTGPPSTPTPPSGTADNRRTPTSLWRRSGEECHLADKVGRWSRASALD